MQFSVAQIIDIAKVSLYLASVDVQKGNLYSPRVIPESAKMIYMELKAVEWMYNQKSLLLQQNGFPLLQQNGGYILLNDLDESLKQTSNYLYSICRGYNLEAMKILGIGYNV